MEPIQRQRALARVALLAGLPPAAIAALVTECGWRTYERGADIIGQESDDTNVYFIAEGQVRVTIFARSGREIAFRDLGEGTGFGELSAIDGLARSASVVALRDTVLASIPRVRFWSLLRNHHSVTERLLKQLTALIRNLTERVVDYSTLAVRNRIQAELVRMAREAGVSANRSLITPAPRHADIASRVATTREAVARELNRLARQGILERRRGALAVLDVRQLVDLVDKVRGS